MDEFSTAVCALCPGSQERWKATVSTRNFTLHVRQLVTGTPANLTQHWVRYLRRLVRQTYAGVQAKHISQLAAGLSYYFVISLFPLLIAFAAALALVPLPNLFDQILALMAKFVPSDSMGFGPHRSERCDHAAWGKPSFCWNFGDNLGGLRWRCGAHRSSECCVRLAR